MTNRKWHQSALWRLRAVFGHFPVAVVRRIGPAQPPVGCHGRETGIREAGGLNTQPWWRKSGQTPIMTGKGRNPGLEGDNLSS